MLHMQDNMIVNKKQTSILVPLIGVFLVFVFPLDFQSLDWLGFSIGALLIIFGLLGYLVISQTAFDLKKKKYTTSYRIRFLNKTLKKGSGSFKEFKQLILKSQGSGLGIFFVLFLERDNGKRIQLKIFDKPNHDKTSKETRMYAESLNLRFTLEMPQRFKKKFFKNLMKDEKKSKN